MGYFVYALASAALALWAGPVVAQELISTQDGIFICHGDHPRCSWPDQETYPYPQFSMQHVGQMSGVSDLLPNGPSLEHYQTFLTELITERPNTNAVASWSDATSVVNNGRVWGGFISVRSGFSHLSPVEQATADSQLIGLEVNVLNGGLPGVYPNQSKVGVQIVGFGNANTNALEVLTQTPSAAFQNILNIQPHAVSPNGAVIGMAPQAAARGIDFQGSTFSDGAMIVSTNQKFVFRTPGLSDASIWRDDINNGYLVLQAGPPGLRIVNSDNNKNLLIITSAGDLVTPNGSFSGVVNRLTALEQVIGGLGGDTGGTGGSVAIDMAANNASAAPATGANSAAGGAGAVASGGRSVALGNSSTASATQSTAVGNGASSTGSNSVALGANSTDGGQSNVVSVGSAGQTRRITNVSNGVNTSDAVNLGQLNNSMSQVLSTAEAYTNMRFSQVSYDIATVRKDANGSTASAMALSGIPQSYERGRGMVGMGVSTWQGESAIAIGASKATDDGQFVFKVGATYNSRSQGGANAGVGFAF